MTDSHLRPADGPAPRPGIARARQELEATRMLCDGGYPAQAVSRAFHAARFAAEAALAALGETRDRPSDVVSAFVRRVVRERAMDPASGRVIRSLFNRAVLADSTFAPVPAGEAVAALADATFVVEGVDEWLDDPTRSMPPDGGATRLPARPAKRRRA
ncbi:MAG: hypothetical protein OJJ54_12280 [Pseudonocardia sp.]|nr:hypothetical protein [Pseudonocardia sp.]